MRISRPSRDWSSWPMVPSTGSALDLCSNPVKLVCAEPYWAIIRSSLRDFALQTAVATPGLERNAHRTERLWMRSCHDSAVSEKPRWDTVAWLTLRNGLRGKHATGRLAAQDEARRNMWKQGSLTKGNIPPLISRDNSRPLSSFVWSWLLALSECQSFDG